MKNIYVIALAAILFQGCGQKKEMTAPATRPVKTTIVESRSVIRKDFSGIVEAVEYVKLAFRVSGQIISLPVIEGEKVKKGQLIAAIDPEISHCSMLHQVCLRNGFRTSGTQQAPALPASDLRAGV